MVRHSRCFYCDKLPAMCVGANKKPPSQIRAPTASRLSSMSPRLQLNKSLVKQIIAYIHSDPLAKVHKLLTFDQVFISNDEELVHRLFFEIGTRGCNLTESVKQDYFGDDFDWDFWYDGTFCSDLDTHVKALEHKKVLKLTEQELFSDDSDDSDDFFG